MQGTVAWQISTMRLVRPAISRPNNTKGEKMMMLKITEMDQTIVPACDLASYSAPNAFIRGLIDAARETGTATLEDSEGCPVTATIWSAKMTKQHDSRTVANCTITWFEDRKSGRGYLSASFDDGGKHECEWPGQPINAATDSDEVAQWIANDLSLDVLSVDHDGEFVHATMRQR